MYLFPNLSVPAHWGLLENGLSFETKFHSDPTTPGFLDIVFDLFDCVNTALFQYEHRSVNRARSGYLLCSL